MTDLRSVIPKPRSIDKVTLKRGVDGAVRVDRLTRGACGQADLLLAYLEDCAAGAPVVLLDIGGYFAPALREVAERFSGRVLGVVYASLGHGLDEALLVIGATGTGLCERPICQGFAAAPMSQP